MENITKEELKELFEDILKKTTIYPQNWAEVRTFKLEEGREKILISGLPEEGSYFQVLDLDGAASVTLDTSPVRPYNLVEVAEVTQLFHEIYLSNPPQSGKNLTLLIGKGPFSLGLRALYKNIAAFSLTPLGANGVYTSDWFDIIYFSAVSLLVGASAPSKEDGCHIQQSIDGVMPIYEDLYTATLITIGGVPGYYVKHEDKTQGKYIRFIYENGAVPQVYFELLGTVKVIG